MACDVAVCHLDPRERTHFQHTCDPCFNRRALIILDRYVAHLALGQTNMPVFLSLQIIIASPFPQASADAAAFLRLSQSLLQALCSLLLFGIIL